MAAPHDLFTPGLFRSEMELREDTKLLIKALIRILKSGVGILEKLLEETA